ncbi:MAG: ribonuclease J [Deltaproteobacteria bacterium]|nr:MAG: ribonuclease J [Deltaproteobacteria bacterium]
MVTHAHEDHIGAVAYLFKELKLPIYGSPLPLAMIGNKFNEHGLSKEKSYFRYVEKRRVIRIGDFDVEWIHITHSVIDASSLAITTDAGTIIHTGDFKIDNTPIDGYPIDYHRLAYYGERGVLALFSDSTNSFKEEFTKSESIVGKTFDELFSKTRHRVIMSTFSSNIHRVYQAIASAKKYGRKVAVIGRSMDKNLGFAIELGYIDVDQKMIVSADEITKLPDDQVLIITTGSQGEPQSALFRMSTNEHRHIKLKPTDTVIISAKAIPGNEGSVSTIINQILKTGARVAYQEFSEIHVSGHASQEEQKFMIRLVKPKFFIPAHGEYQHILRHAKTAKECGIDDKNIIMLDDGDAVELGIKGYKRLKKVRSGKTFIDNQINKQIDHAIVYDRQNLANDGIVMLVLQLDRQGGALMSAPKVMSYGLVNANKEREFAQELEKVIDTFVSTLKLEQFSNAKQLEHSLRQVLKKHIFRNHKKYPIIVPTLYIQ